MIPERALVLFDRSGLPRCSPSQSLTIDDIHAQVSLDMTFFWAMAFIAAKKIARSDTDSAFDLLRMMRGARDRIQLHRSGTPVPAWGTIPTPHDPLPPTDPPGQLGYLRELIADLSTLQPTTNAVGGLVTPAAVAAINAFVQRISRQLQT